ncbi:hypothetical protein IQ266_25565 [filamentous cyanobacterium LEGE 11480]|uniref:Uncharacterized protein n=1 Tax=Romeriopsis navalis LEGE 11480 TaxID=2777977 RepID=A0A928Z7E6_9CYAN|nr:hypothetical protein [Romeriopsis navalis]MBE9033110.1 hypothetical protein [Romeriopsis navalis LEGE 11480]
MLKLLISPLVALGLIVLAPVAAVANPASVMPATAAGESSSVYRREKIEGEVQQVEGSTIVLALADGQTRRVPLPDAENGNFDFLIGKRIVLTQIVCEKPLPVVETLPVKKTVIIPQLW